MSLPNILKSIIYLFLSVLIIFIYSGALPKIINIIPESTEKVVMYSMYYIGIVVIIGLPQYYTWFQQDADLPIITPIISMALLAVSIAFASITSVIVINLLVTLELSAAALIFFNFGYWIALMGMLIVPQYLIYEKGASHD